MNEDFAKIPAEVKYQPTKPLEWYKEGFDLLVHAVPTKGKKLSDFTYIESMLESFKELSCYIDTLNHPIFVFDQSDEPLFLENRDYLSRFKKQVVHLGTKDIISLAKKLHVEELIFTSKRVGCGYGGARNAIFLLAPLLYKEQTGKQSAFIHMGDDDLYVPKAAVFEDCLWAYTHKGKYAERFGSVVGRFAQDASFLPEDLDKIVNHCPWLDTPFVHGMSGLITSPKLCLNLPFGQEENHMLALESEFNTTGPSLYHLAGPRMPIDGVAKFLRSRYVDMVERLLVTELLDPNNRYNICALPWNLRDTPFMSFQEMVEVVSSEATKQAMQKQFWINLERAHNAFSLPITGPYIHSSQALQKIIDLDLRQLDQELQDFYRDFAFEASQYKLFMMLIQDKNVENAKSRFEAANGPLEEYPLAYALYLFCKNIGCGHFCTLVSRFLE